MAKAPFSLTAKPTFKCKVDIPIPGDKPATVEFIFKGRTREEFKTFIESLAANYLDAGYQSEGAAVRIAMDALPAIILLPFRKKFVWQPAERNLWISMSVLALASIIWLLVSSSSTAVDSLAL